MKHFIGGFAAGDVLLIAFVVAMGFWRDRPTSVKGPMLLFFGALCGLAAWGLWP